MHYQNPSISQYCLLRNPAISIGSRFEIPGFRRSGPLDRQRNLATISQVYRPMGSNPIAPSEKCASWYSIATLLRDNRLECRLGDLTDSRRVESKSSYSATRRREIEIFGKRVSTGSRYRSEIAKYLEKK